MKFGSLLETFSEARTDIPEDSPDVAPIYAVVTVRRKADSAQLGIEYTLH